MDEKQLNLYRRRIEIIVKMITEPPKGQGVKQVEVAKKLKMTPQRVNQIWQNYLNGRYKQWLKV